MSRVNIYIHAVFGVHRRHPTLKPEKRALLFAHIQDQAKKHAILLMAINGHDDHVHVLLALKSTQTISQCIQLIKGESAWWANQQAIFEYRLRWAEGYFARSVDPLKIATAKKYIGAQSKHDWAFPFVLGYLQSIPF
jgi:putative transposase